MPKFQPAVLFIKKNRGCGCDQSASLSGEKIFPLNLLGNYFQAYLFVLRIGWAL